MKESLAQKASRLLTALRDAFRTSPRVIRSRSSEYLPLALAVPTERPPDETLALLSDVRHLLERLRPPRANNTWALYAGQHGLTLVLPLDRREGSSLEDQGSLHTSLQLHLDQTSAAGRILGTWEDAHYAWDSPNARPDFASDGIGPRERDRALEWLAVQLRRPILRRDWIFFGRTVCSSWIIREGARTLFGEARGFLPVRLVLPATRTVPAGFLDPWPGSPHVE